MLRLFGGHSLREIARTIGAIHCAHPFRVAIDGPVESDCARVALEVGAALAESGRAVLSVAASEMPNTRSVEGESDVFVGRRCASFGGVSNAIDRGALDPALLEDVLLPMGPGGNLRPRIATRHVGLGESSLLRSRRICPNSILLVHGCFLHEAELRAHWDFSVYVGGRELDSLARRTAGRRPTRSRTDLDPRLLGEGHAQQARLEYIARVRPADRASAIVRPRELRMQPPVAEALLPA